MQDASGAVAGTALTAPISQAIVRPPQRFDSEGSARIRARRIDRAIRAEKPVHDLGVRLPVHLDVGIDEVVQRIAGLRRVEDELAAYRELHAVLVVRAEEVLPLGTISGPWIRRRIESVTGVNLRTRSDGKRPIGGGPAIVAPRRVREQSSENASDWRSCCRRRRGVVCGVSGRIGHR